MALCLLFLWALDVYSLWIDIYTLPTDGGIRMIVSARDVLGGNTRSHERLAASVIGCFRQVRRELDTTIRIPPYVGNMFIICLYSMSKGNVHTIP